MSSRATMTYCTRDLVPIWTSERCKHKISLVWKTLPSLNLCLQGSDWSREVEFIVGVSGMDKIRTVRFHRALRRDHWKGFHKFQYFGYFFYMVWFRVHITSAMYLMLDMLCILVGTILESQMMDSSYSLLYNPDFWYPDFLFTIKKSHQRFPKFVLGISS